MKDSIGLGQMIDTFESREKPANPRAQSSSIPVAWVRPNLAAACEFAG
jgi:hypothetical protein